METKEELPGPVILDVVPISCSMTMTRSRDDKSPLPDTLSMRLRLVDDEVRTSDERELTNVLWTMTFYEGGSGNKFTELHNAIGMINYYQEWQSKHDDIDGSAEACHAWANLDPPTFAILRDMAQAGRLPSGLRLHAYGINYGWEPDGSLKVWDVKAHKNAPISQIEINANFVKLPDSVSDADESDAFRVDRPQDAPEIAAMRGLAKAVDHVNARLGWVIGLLALALVVVIFR